ncbi:hypothetical protein O6H91_01G108600 [Diphasiastrum complanatum]|uniref:Uncharacterized protein n=1 Tax=Diphasiastrum complanatum TaxID=34168 RepID=A0ACC2EUH2_DIPCM|nr:hypothetical protein O6H91_01G108600 [Diphasiastrum complanatum]
MASAAQIGDESEFLRTVDAAFQDSDNAVLVAFRVAKSQASWSVAGRRNRLTTKPRVLAITAMRSSSTQKFSVNLQVLKYSSGGLQPAKVYKLKHLTKIEAVPNDNTGCTFVMGFDNLKSQSVAPPQWTMRSLDDRNRFLTCILKLCKENLGRLPKIQGMDVVELALWAQANVKGLPIGSPVQADSVDAERDQKEGKVTVERELLSKAEEDDMEALLGAYLLGIDEAEAFSERLKRELLALEAANVHAILESEPLVEEVLQDLDSAMAGVEEMEIWLGVFNIKLRHMREDIESIESRNNMLEMQVQNNALLVGELYKLLERLHVPSEVKDKRTELEKLKSTFLRRASDFLRNYFSSLVDFMITDKTYFSQRGQLKRPDHADLRFRCRTYARLLQHLKSLDKSSLEPLRNAYCHALNLLLRREAREFANELRASTKVSRSSGAWLDGSTSGSGFSGSGSDTATATVSDAYAKMLRIFIPLLVDEVMCHP